MSTMVKAIHQALAATAEALEAQDPIAAERALGVAGEVCRQAAAAGVAPSREALGPLLELQRRCESSARALRERIARSVKEAGAGRRADEAYGGTP